MWLPERKSRPSAHDRVHENLVKRVRTVDGVGGARPAEPRTCGECDHHFGKLRTSVDTDKGVVPLEGSRLARHAYRGRMYGRRPI